jgi:hypothetical protein
MAKPVAETNRQKKAVAVFGEVLEKKVRDAA